MVSNTRSGRLQTVEDTDRNSGMNLRELRSRRSAPSSLAPRGSGTMRKTKMKTPPKTSQDRLIVNTPSSSRKQSLDAKTSHSSPIRRSQRVKKVTGSSSSALNEYESSSLGKRKKVDEKKDRKTSVAGTSKESNAKKICFSDIQSPKNRKWIDAVSYRTLLSSKPSVEITSDVSARARDDDPSKENMVKSAVGDSTEGLESGDECPVYKGEEFHEKHCDQEANEVEGSSDSVPEEVNRETGKDISSASFNSRQDKLQNGDTSSLKCSAYPVENAAEGCSNSLNPEEAFGHRLSAAEISPENKALSLASESTKWAPALKSNTSESLKNKYKSVQEVLGANNSRSLPSAIKIANMEAGKKDSELIRKRGSKTPSDGKITPDLVDKESVDNFRMESEKSSCDICGHPDTELRCDGMSCNRRYHLSCLDPPLKKVPLGLWFCISCIKKKLKYDIYSISKGYDSVWNHKEGGKGENQYLVKYKGLAHVHNQWIPEAVLIKDAPALLAYYRRKYQKNKVIRWKQEWTKPHRVLQKRLLMPKEIADKFFSELGDSHSKCYNEWLVKWKGLGYEECTWELENSTFLSTQEASSLITDYEVRNDTKSAVDSSRSDMALQLKKSPFQKLLSLPDGCATAVGIDHLDSINKLREFWHRSQNAIFIGDQERVVKSILFIASGLPHSCRPFLIISSSSCISSWETEFNRLAPFVNVVVYNGNKNARKLIQEVEFYNNGGCIVFEVLLSHADAVIEDIEKLQCIGWEALLIDDCQRSAVSKHFKVFNSLSADFRLLLLNGQLKDNAADYLNMLLFLDSGGIENNTRLKLDSSEDVATLALLKERLAHHIAYEKKPDSSKLIEYWVPVHLSNVQLEQYCYSLISNSMTLRSCSKTDQVGALKDILISVRKCCDHPYLVDELLQGRLKEKLDSSNLLDIGVHASGKLLVLERILQAMQKQEFRVVIYFQSIAGGGRTCMGDILEDFLRHRFGNNSYERVDSGSIYSKSKFDALNKFNDKSEGRFVFLIESRACLPSVRLLSVDAVLLYNCDWNPLNDLKLIQKMSIESTHEHLIVFRLFSVFSVEEKFLIFAKQGLILESKTETTSPSLSHALLSWGVTYLFKQFDEFHQHDQLTNLFPTSRHKLLLESTVREIINSMPSNIACSSSTCSTLIKAEQSGTSYSEKIILIGEKEGISSFDKDPHTFWSNLLEGRNPRWWYICEPSRRSRRKADNITELAKLSDIVSVGVKKKRKVVNNITELKNSDLDSLVSWLQVKTNKGAEQDNMLDRIHSLSETVSPTSANNATSLPSNNHVESDILVDQELVITESGVNSDSVVEHMIHSEHTSPTSSGVNKGCTLDSARGKLRDAQRSLSLLLKPKLLKLCEVLDLPDNVKDLVLVLLEYIMTNHQVDQQPETTIHALEISLCLRASSLLKHKINRQESLVLAKKFLGFLCDEDEVNMVYSKLRILKRKFHQKATMNNKEANILDDLKNTKHSSIFPQPSPDQQDVDLIIIDSSLLRGSTGDNTGCSLLAYSRGVESIPIHIQNSDSQSGSSVEAEPCRPRDTVLKVSPIDSLQQEADLPRRTDKTVSQSCAMNTQVIETNSRLMADVANEQQSAACPSDVSLEEAGLPMNTDNVVSQSCDMNSEAIQTNRTLIVDLANEQCSGAGGSEVSCLRLSPSLTDDQERYAINDRFGHQTSSPQDGAESLQVYVTTAGSETGASLNQETNKMLHERPRESISLEGQDCRSVEDIPPSKLIDVGSLQLELINNDMTASDPIQPVLLPSSNFLSLGQREQASAPDSVENHVEPLIVMQYSAEQNHSALQVPAGSSSHLEFSAGNESVIHVPRQASTSLSTQNQEGPLNLVQCSAQQIDTPLPVSVGSSFLPVEQSLPVDQPLPIEQPLPVEQFSQLVSHPLVNPLLSNLDVSARGTSEELATDIQSEPVHHFQLFPLVSLPHQDLQSEPLKNELTRIRIQQDKVSKMHEDRTMHIKREYDEEMKKLTKKYDRLLQDAESEFLVNKMTLETIYNKVLMNHIFAEEFKAKFIENKGSKSPTFQGQNLLQGSQPQLGHSPVLTSSMTTSVGQSQPSHRPVLTSCMPITFGQSQLSQRPVLTSTMPNSVGRLSAVGQPQLSQRPVLTSTMPNSVVTSMTIGQPQLSQRPVLTSSKHNSVGSALPTVVAPTLVASVRLRGPTSIVAPMLSGQTSRNSAVNFQNNAARPYFNSTVSPSANISVASEIRAPAPHLHRFRPAAAIPSHSFSFQTSVTASQQHLLTNTISANTNQPAPLPQDSCSSPTVLPMDVRDSQVGANLANLSSILNGSVASGTAPQIASSSASDNLVLISDDEV